MGTATAERGRCARSDSSGGSGGDGEPPAVGTRMRFRDAPTMPAKTLVGVVVEEHAGAVFTTRYRLGWIEETVFGPVERTCLVDPALVVALPADNADLPHVVPAAEAVVDPADRELLRWCQCAANVERTADGRFEAELTNGGGLSGGPTFTVRDLWTDEAVRGLATQPAAHNWCRTRREGRCLAWTERPEGAKATAGDGVWFAVLKGLAPGSFVGVDYRFAPGVPGERLRKSPEFVTEEQARAWCAVRACCTVEPGPALRYEAPIPF